jgi:hypothetical protein
LIDINYRKIITWRHKQHVKSLAQLTSHHLCVEQKKKFRIIKYLS